MSNTFVQTFTFNYDVSSMGQSYNSLEEVIDKYLKDKPTVSIKQIEFLWGNRYGARIAVLFEEEQAHE